MLEHRFASAVAHNSTTTIFWTRLDGRCSHLWVHCHRLAPQLAELQFQNACCFLCSPPNLCTSLYARQIALYAGSCVPVRLHRDVCFRLLGPVPRVPVGDNEAESFVGRPTLGQHLRQHKHQHTGGCSTGLRSAALYNAECCLYSAERCLCSAECCLYRAEGCLYGAECCLYRAEGCLYSAERCLHSAEGCLCSAERCLYSAGGCLYSAERCLYSAA